MKVTIFISDEGFGHTIRQRSVIDELLKKKIKVTVVTSANINILKEKFQDSIIYRDKFNNICTIKKKSGSLDIDATKKQFRCWYKNYDNWIREEITLSREADFFISDFVPEAFELAKILNIKCFGVCHFTWDWFYKKILKSEDEIYRKLSYFIGKSTKLYFPPLTSKDILKKYKKNTFLVNFILSDFSFLKKRKEKEGKIKNCLIIDNGNQTLRSLIIKTIPYLQKNKNVKFLIRNDLLNKGSQKIIAESKNLLPVHGLKNTHSKIIETDFIVARGGFNTISECLVLKKPAIFYHEKRNPEIFYNLKTLNNLGLCGFLNKKDWGRKFNNIINLFLQNKFSKLKKKLDKQKYLNTGAREIVNDILKEIKN